MKKTVIEIEYDASFKKKEIRKTVKKNGRKLVERTKVDVKDPKCWEVITVQDNSNWMPGQRLTEAQFKLLTKMNSTTVRIGLPGQFRKHGNNRGY
tara:strand:- start:247 stop:531 length:285 start_codon:yes stop_codon:yes gene_type:complete